MRATKQSAAEKFGKENSQTVTNAEVDQKILQAKLNS